MDITVLSTFSNLIKSVGHDFIYFRVDFKNWKDEDDDEDEGQGQDLGNHCFLDKPLLKEPCHANFFI